MKKTGKNQKSGGKILSKYKYLNKQLLKEEMLIEEAVSEPAAQSGDEKTTLHYRLVIRRTQCRQKHTALFMKT